jgi:hypothetical protein
MVDGTMPTGKANISWYSLTPITDGIAKLFPVETALTQHQPNDEEEQDRMDLLHHIYGMILKGELNYAPIAKDPQRVLDLGTGTGQIFR